MAKRLLITGSRSWTDLLTMRWALQVAINELWMPAPDGAPILVSGACPDGADAMAEQIWEDWRAPVERHPAKWRLPDGTIDRDAGFARNALMVGLGADLCLAFISVCNSPRCRIPGQHPSHGARHTADLAERAGIPTQRYTA